MQECPHKIMAKWHVLVARETDESLLHNFEDHRGRVNDGLGKGTSRC